jgi:heme-degrading monooxygenase HmoA
VLFSHHSLHRYETPEANQQTHRAGEDYKQFRAAVASEGLFTEYPDLRFWKPTDVGFMTRSPVNFMSDRKGEKQYFVVQEFSPAEGGKANLLEILGEVAGRTQSLDKVKSFWALDRADPEDGEDVVVVSRFDSKEDYDALFQSEREAWKTVSGQVKAETVTTWVEAGIGFLDR